MERGVAVKIYVRRVLLRWAKRLVRRAAFEDVRHGIRCTKLFVFFLYLAKLFVFRTRKHT